jgi:hypothetical protein
MSELTALYASDILDWSERQATLLRRFASADRVNDAIIDWENVIEEIESVGRAELHAVESLLTQALLHLLKAEAWSDSLAVPGWEAEARLFLRQARRRFTPSMRQRLSVAELYADALAGLPEAIDGQAPMSVASECPVALDALLGTDQIHLRKVVADK